MQSTACTKTLHDLMHWNKHIALRIIIILPMKMMKSTVFFFFDRKKSSSTNTNRQNVHVDYADQCWLICMYLWRQKFNDWNQNFKYDFVYDILSLMSSEKTATQPAKTKQQFIEVTSILYKLLLCCITIVSVMYWQFIQVLQVFVLRCSHSYSYCSMHRQSRFVFMTISVM